MKNKELRNLLTLIVMLLVTTSGFAAEARDRLPDFAKGWKACMDAEAKWQDDQIYLPDELPALSDLAVNVPTMGWDKLYHEGKTCSLPASVEELFGTSNTWQYHGVSWFYKMVDIPASWKGKHCVLHIGQYRQRIEIYVNEQLAGYDAVGMTPYQCDIAKYIKPGTTNRIAFRITNPGGNRGWEDFQKLKWGNTELLSDKDYGGIGGDVSLVALGDIRVDDVFVKNLLPACKNNIEVQVASSNLHDDTFAGTVAVEISDCMTGQVVYQHNDKLCLYHGSNVYRLSVCVPAAKRWSPDSPALYRCKVNFSDGQGLTVDSYSQTFGFRVFEVKDADGQNNFYLNGERIRFRSAIDWGMYAFTGLYPKPEVARRSIEAVRQVGHNALNCHRRLGDAALLDAADSLGVYIYEEPGGFHCGGQARDISKSAFMRRQIYERIRRMTLRDRNHPSLLVYTLCNEDNVWNEARERAMRIISDLDGTRLVLNSSGGSGGGYMDGEPHLRPYEHELKTNYCDNHTVYTGVYFNEGDINLTFNERHDDPRRIDHFTKSDSTIVYWGEVRCNAGTFNNYLINKQNGGMGGYDLNLYRPQAEKVAHLFETCNMKGSAHGNIQAPEDVIRQAGRGQMYTDGRLGQRIMACSANDGYAINGWSPGPDMPDDWSSAITDMNRNVNGSASDMAYWNRPLQIAIFRMKGKYFNVGDKATYQICLINEGKLPKGTYELNLRLKDGIGRVAKFKLKKPIEVAGGDCFAQTLIDSLKVTMTKDLAPGYITLEASLVKNGKTVADGAEQVLLKNRGKAMLDHPARHIAVRGWAEASCVLRQSGIPTETNVSPSSYIIIGKDATSEDWDEALLAVQAGANALIRMDSISAEKLFARGLLAAPVKTWGGLQTGYWRGNGSAYIGDFLGSQSIPSHGVISTRSWEVTGDPKGFWPFESKYAHHVYSAYFAHKQQSDSHFNDDNNTLVVMGGIDYGKGHIILSSAYFVDEDNAFTDMLFFGMIGKKTWE